MTLTTDVAAMVEIIRDDEPVAYSRILPVNEEAGLASIRHHLPQLKAMGDSVREDHVSVLRAELTEHLPSYPWSDGPSDLIWDADAYLEIAEMEEPTEAELRHWDAVQNIAERVLAGR